MERFSRRDHIPLLLTALFLVGAIAFAFWPPIALNWIPAGTQTEDLQRIGLFGDAFGGLNALFAFLAFMAVAYGLWVELRRSEAHAAETARQAKLIQQQAFESTFFNQLKLNRELVEASVFWTERGDDFLRGRQGLLETSMEIKRDLDVKAGAWGLIPDPQHVHKLFDHGYLFHYRRNEDALGAYFRSLYHLFKLIDVSAVGDKTLYVNLARAQLSSAELVLIAVNCAAFVDGGLRGLVLRHRLLKHLRDDGSPMMVHLRAAYPSGMWTFDPPPS